VFIVCTFHVVTDFLHRTLLGSVQHHLELTFLHLHHDRLFTHPPHHVERRLGLPPQRQLQDVFLDTLLDGLPERLLDGKEPVSRTHPFEPLMGSLMVVVFHP